MHSHCHSDIDEHKACARVLHRSSVISELYKCHMSVHCMYVDIIHLYVRAHKKYLIGVPLETEGYPNTFGCFAHAAIN